MSLTMIVPTLGDRSRLLQRTVASLQACSPPATIVVVITPEDRMDSVRRLLPPAVSVRSEPRPRAGLAAAVNDAWNRAHTELLAWIGDDDLLRPGFAQACGQLASRPDCAGAYGRMELIDATDRVLRRLRPGRPGLTLSRFGPNLLPHPGSVYRREAVEAVGLLREDLPHSMDLDLFLKLAAWRRGLCYVPKTLGAFRWHEDSQTVRTPDVTEAEARSLRISHNHLAAVGPVGSLTAVAARVYYRYNALLDRMNVRSD